MTLDELYDRKRVIEDGMSGKFWGEVSAALRGQLMARRNALTSLPVRDLSAAFEAAALQAEIGLLQFVIGMPQFMLDDVRRDIEAVTAEQESEGGRTGRS